MEARQEKICIEWVSSSMGISKRHKFLCELRFSNILLILFHGNILHFPFLKLVYYLLCERTCCFSMTLKTRVLIQVILNYIVRRVEINRVKFKERKKERKKEVCFTSKNSQVTIKYYHLYFLWVKNSLGMIFMTN